MAVLKPTEEEEATAWIDAILEQGGAARPGPERRGARAEVRVGEDQGLGVVG